MSKKTKSYLIEEKNEQEGEDFGYIVKLTDKQFQDIYDRIEDIRTTQDSEYSLTIDINVITPKEVKLINSYCDNDYMDRLGYYELTYPEDMLRSFDPNLFAYKGRGLRKIKTK